MTPKSDCVLLCDIFAGIQKGKSLSGGLELAFFLLQNVY